MEGLQRGSKRQSSSQAKKRQTLQTAPPPPEGEVQWSQVKAGEEEREIRSLLISTLTGEGEAESAGWWLSKLEAAFLVLPDLLLGSTAQGSEPGGGAGLRHKECREHAELGGEEGMAGPLEEQAF